MNAAAQPHFPAWSPPADSLRIEFCGLSLATPVVLLSGCVGYGEDYPRVAGFTHRDVGAVCLAGTTLLPRPGHPPHRLVETPMGLLNAVGLQNPGVEHVVAKVLPRLDFTETRFFANVSGATVDEYVEVVRRFDDSPVDAIELNVACASVPEDGRPFGNDPALCARVVEACRRVTRKPLVTKLSPDQADVRESARRCIEAGTDAFAVCNTPAGLAVDVRRRRAVLGHGQGWLSGPAIKPIALLKTRQVHEVAKPHRIPIIGQGGIRTVDDALEFLIAGASCIGLGTALFYDPLLCRRIDDGIAQYLAAEGFASVAQLTGTLS